MLVLIVVAHTGITSAFINVSYDGNVSRMFNLNVIFVGYSTEVVNTTLIDLNIEKSYLSTYDNYTIDYSFSTSYHFANSSYYDSLKSISLANSVNGTNTTSALNTTALQIQKNTGEKMSIFTDQSGRAIDALAVESWLEANPAVHAVDSSYWFYVLNFSEFDSLDHELEHWYNVTEIDCEANSKRDFWRLDWDNTLNPNVKFPYASFTSQSRIMLVDPSAFQWYLTWARVWWGLGVTGPKYDYYYEDLDQFSATHDLNTVEGKTALGYYLAGWLGDLLRNLLQPRIWNDVGIFDARSISVQTLILNNASEAGYTNDEMNWILNTTKVQDSISDLSPFIEVNVTLRFEYLSDCPEIKSILKDAVLKQQNGITYYDGEKVWDSLYNARDTYFDLDAADIVVSSYVLLEPNMSMFVYGGEYTGLGGGGQVLIMKSIERYFREDEVTPKSGLGIVLIHEAGHNLGLDHIFTHGSAYAGDFAFDVMGYYPYSYSFTQLRKDSWIRLIDDYHILQLQDKINADQQIYNRKAPQPSIDNRFVTIQTGINDANQFYAEMRFLEAYHRIEETEAYERELNKIIWVYLSDTNIDNYANAKDAITIGVAFGSHVGSPSWDPRADITGDDYVNASDAVILGTYFGTEWS